MKKFLAKLSIDWPGYVMVAIIVILMIALVLLVVHGFSTGEIRVRVITP